MSDAYSPLESLPETVRLFPLPNLVLFPNVVQPLHIFEPRYRQMTADALAGDRLIAMALLKPGWEKNYEGAPAVHPIACLGRILAEQPLEDGRYNLLVRGEMRVRLVEEFDGGKLYRTFRVEPVADLGVPEGKVERDLRRRLKKVAGGWLHEQKGVLEQFRGL